MSRDGEHLCYLSSPEKEMGITREERGGEGVGGGGGGTCFITFYR